MSLSNLSLVNTTVLPNFNEISPQSNVRFSLQRGNRNYIIGRGNKGYSCRERPFVLTNYSVVFPALKRSEYDELMSYIDGVQHEIQYFAFNDFSDNYVLNWEKDAVTQSGVLVELGTSGSLLDGNPQQTQYQLCKKYTVGQEFTLKPIYYIPEDAEVYINGQLIQPNDNNLNRKTGIFSGLQAGEEGITFQTDFYYTLVRITSAIKIDHYYSEGLENEGLDPSNNLGDKQLLTVSFQMQEVRLNQVLKYTNLVGDANLEPITKLDLDCYVNQSSREEKRYFNRFEHNSFVAQEKPANSKETVELTIPSRVSNHRDLIYLQTIFKACAGTAFTLD